MQTYRLKLAIFAAALALPFTSSEAQTQTVELNAHDHGESATLYEHEPDNVVNSINYVSVRRFNQGGTVIRNNIGAFRFDLTTEDKLLPGGNITSAELSFALQTANKGITATFNVYGLNADAAKGSVTAQNWFTKFDGNVGVPGSVTFNTMPGLLEAEGDMSNSAINPAETVLLGTITVPANTVAGSALTFSTQELLDYINGNVTGSVSFLLETRLVGVSGRDEDVALLSGNRSSAGAYFYPTLTMEQQIPEAGHAAALMLLAAAGVVYARRRVRNRARD